MLDGLRREFPEVSAIARRVPNPRVARTSVYVSPLLEIGAAVLVLYMKAAREVTATETA